MESKKSVLVLVDGPNMIIGCKDHDGLLNLITRLDEIKKRAERYGELKDALIYYGIDSRENTMLLKLSIESGFHPIVGSGRTDIVDIDSKLIEDAEKYLEKGEFDIFALASGDGHYINLMKSVPEYGKESLLIYPKGRGHEQLINVCKYHECIRPQKMITVLKEQLGLQNYHP